MEALLKLLPSRPQPLWVRYGLTCLLVASAFLILLGLKDRAGPYGFILFIPPIVLASIAFDRGSGLLALSLSTIAVAVMLPASSSIRQHLAPFVVFVLIGIGLVLISEGMRKAMERAVEAELEKDLLLRELSHRLKNNLAIAASILGLQGRSQSDPAVRSAFEAAVARLSVMAKAHDHLQQAGQKGLVNMKEYIEELGKNLGDALRDARAVALRVEAEQLWLDAQEAVPIGIIVNELVTNAFKYAFPAETSTGSVTVALRREGQKEISLSVTDSGIGCPDDAPQGLGSKLVTLFTEQLGGTVRRMPAKPGCLVIATFPLESRNPE